LSLFEAVQGRVLYKQIIGDHSSGSVTLENEKYIYFNNSKICIGQDPELECKHNDILAKKADMIICPQKIKFTAERNISANCVYEYKDLTVSKTLQNILQDPLKVIKSLFAIKYRSNSLKDRLMKK
jgi:hypothetical protein